MSQGLWIAIAVVAALVVIAALVLGLLRYRRRRISLSRPEPSALDRSGGYTASSGITFSQGTATVDRIDTSGLPAVGDDATVPRDAPKRTISDVLLPEPVARARTGGPSPNPNPQVAEPSEPEPDVAPPTAAEALRNRGHRAVRRPTGTAARAARPVAERAGAQHAGAARRRRPGRGLLAGRRGHAAGRRPGPGGHRVGGVAAARAGWPAATCVPRPTPGRCCATC